MNRIKEEKNENLYHVPRERGDEPAHRDWAAIPVGCSPRARG